MVASVSTRELVLVALLGAAALNWTLSHLRRVPEGFAMRRFGEKAWLLIVHLQFESAADIDKFIEAFAPMGDAVSRTEPDTLGYEVSRSEKDPLKLMIFERYRTLDAYLKAHKSTKHFLKFRPKLQALQDAKKVIITGESYQELGVGFM
jgi:quinol monooxygenase YgiN